MFEVERSEEVGPAQLNLFEKGLKLTDNPAQKIEVA